MLEAINELAALGLILTITGITFYEKGNVRTARFLLLCLISSLSFMFGTKLIFIFQA